MSLTSRFPYDFPDTPAGMDVMMTHYLNPFSTEVSKEDAISAKSALLHMFSLVARENQMAGVVVPSAERGENALRSLFEGVSSCLIPVHLKVEGKGRIVLPCAVGTVGDD